MFDVYFYNHNIKELHVFIIHFEVFDLKFTLHNPYSFKLILNILISFIKVLLIFTFLIH
jgi:hypothetical protein